MKKLLLVLVLVSSCAHFKWEKDWEFDCDWARFYDFQNNARNRSSGLPFVSNISAIYCETDPTELRAYQLKERGVRSPLPDEHR